MTNYNSNVRFMSGSYSVLQSQVFVMVATDPDCGSLTYRTWQTRDQPDFSGSQYTGTRCGVSALTNIHVAAKFIPLLQFAIEVLATTVLCNTVLLLIFEAQVLFDIFQYQF